MAPRYASLIRGISMTFSGIGDILSPTVMGYMVSNHVSGFSHPANRNCLV